MLVVRGCNVARVEQNACGEPWASREGHSRADKGIISGESENHNGYCAMENGSLHHTAIRILNSHGLLNFVKEMKLRKSRFSFIGSDLGWGDEAEPGLPHVRFGAHFAL